MSDNRNKENRKEIKDGDGKPFGAPDNQAEINGLFDGGEPDLDKYAQMEAPPEMKASMTRYKISHANQLRRERQHRTIYRITAGIAAMFLLYFGFTKFDTPLFHEVPTLVTVTVNEDAIKQIAFPDGSMATVSPGSVLRYPETFTKTERRIYLDKGEAFFEVAKDPKRPFRVASGELQTTALGTSFTVQYNPSVRREKVNLYTGKVSVENISKQRNISPIVLTPGKSYEFLDGDVVLSDFNPVGNNPVAKGLVFENVPFDEAMYRISSWYGINLLFDRENTKRRWINGNFNNKKIEDIFFILSNTYDLQFTKTDSLTYKIMMTKK